MPNKFRQLKRASDAAGKTIERAVLPSHIQVVLVFTDGCYLSIEHGEGPDYGECMLRSNRRLSYEEKFRLGVSNPDDMIPREESPDRASRRLRYEELRAEFEDQP
jgi:hypothetical protein